MERTYCDQCFNTHSERSLLCLVTCLDEGLMCHQEMGIHSKMDRQHQRTVFGFGVWRSTLREKDFNGVEDSVTSIQGAAFFRVPAPLDAFIMHKLGRWLQQVRFQNDKDPAAPFKMMNAFNSECSKHTLSGITCPKCNKMNWFARPLHVRRGVKDYAAQMWDSVVFNHGLVMFLGFWNLICRKKFRFINVWGITNPVA